MSRVACVTLTPPEACRRTGLHPKAQFGAYSGLGRKAQPSVMDALPPVGWLSTVAQPAHMTAVWACEKTVVLRLQEAKADERTETVGCASIGGAPRQQAQRRRPTEPCDYSVPGAWESGCNQTSAPEKSGSREPHMEKQPGQRTSMKNELGDCTRRLSLCLRFSAAGSGWRRSTRVLACGTEKPKKQRNAWRNMCVDHRP